MCAVALMNGSQSSLEAMKTLNAVYKSSLERPCPWVLNFKCGRAFLEYVAKAWGGLPTEFTNAQEVLILQAKVNWITSNLQIYLDIFLCVLTCH